MKKDADKNVIESAVLGAFEVALDAQLKAIKRLRAEPAAKPTAKQSMSQIDMVFDILQRAGQPLHVTEIIDRVEKFHHHRLERESIVSALVKKIRRNERFVRTGKNIFALKGGK